MPRTRPPIMWTVIRARDASSEAIGSALVTTVSSTSSGRSAAMRAVVVPASLDLETCRRAAGAALAARPAEDARDAVRAVLG